jgi:predicted amidophosphoribosyltransferase
MMAAMRGATSRGSRGVEMQCLNCGGELPNGAAICPHCGVRRRSRFSSPEVWEKASLRSRATVIGLLITAVIVIAAGVLIFTNHRGDTQSAPSILVTP